jgi:hypothetical protein
MRTAVTRPLAIATLSLCIAACARSPAPVADAARDDGTATTDSIAAPATIASTDIAPSQNDEPTAQTRVLYQAFRGGESFATLRDRFGPSNVREQDIAGAEGETTHGVVLYPDDPTRRATLYFADADKLEGLALVRITDPESSWSIEHDIRIGTTLAELVARNGGPIEFSGFGWDYGGAVAGYGGGQLEPRNAMAPQGGFRLAPRPGLPENVDVPQGDRTFSSDDYPGLATDIVVDELTLSFPRQSSNR